MMLLMIFLTWMKNESPSEIGFIDTVNDHIDLLFRWAKMLVMFFLYAKLKVFKIVLKNN
jgi:hypothetical protein